MNRIFYQIKKQLNWNLKRTGQAKEDSSSIQNILKDKSWTVNKLNSLYSNANLTTTNSLIKCDTSIVQNGDNFKTRILTTLNNKRREST